MLEHFEEKDGVEGCIGEGSRLASLEEMGVDAIGAGALYVGRVDVGAGAGESQLRQGEAVRADRASEVEDARARVLAREPEVARRDGLFGREVQIVGPRVSDPEAAHRRHASEAPPTGRADA